MTKYKPFSYSDIFWPFPRGVTVTDFSCSESLSYLNPSSLNPSAFLDSFAELLSLCLFLANIRCWYASVLLTWLWEHSGGQELTWSAVAMPRSWSCSFSTMSGSVKLNSLLSLWKMIKGVRKQYHGDAHLLWTKVRLETERVQGNRVHTINIWGLEISNLDFQPIPIKYDIYSIAAWHPCTFSTKICTTFELNKSNIFGNPRVHRALLHI